MQDEYLLKLIDATSAALNLANTTIEKDYYVTHVIFILSKIENDLFQLQNYDSAINILEDISGNIMGSLN